MNTLYESGLSRSRSSSVVLRHQKVAYLPMNDYWLYRMILVYKFPKVENTWLVKNFRPGSPLFASKILKWLGLLKTSKLQHWELWRKNCLKWTVLSSLANAEIRKWWSWSSFFALLDKLKYHVADYETDAFHSKVIRMVRFNFPFRVFEVVPWSLSILVWPFQSR